MTAAALLGIDADAPQPFALCHCGTPMVSTFEVRHKEWYCVTCGQFFDWLHARRGAGPNPTDELDERHRAAKAQYASERAAREAATRRES